MGDQRVLPKEGKVTNLGTVRLRAPAKVNLFLDVLGRRADGYHEIVTLMVTVDLHDEVEIAAAEDLGGVELRCTGNTENVPSDERNTAHRAASTFLRNHAAGHGVRIYIEKRIPAGGGLGGGSSDAAAVLSGMNRLFGHVASLQELSDTAAAVGSDVPFFLHGGVCVCRGRGERVEPLKVEMPGWFAVILHPRIHISTAGIYEAMGISHAPVLASADDRINLIAQSIERGDVHRAATLMYNALEKAVYKEYPQMLRLAKALEEIREKPLLSGSGSCFFWLTDEEADAHRLACEARVRCGVNALAVRLYDPGRRCEPWK